MSERDPRRKLAQDVDLNPQSLCGSYALYEGDTVKEALVVAEVQPGVYLLEFNNLVTGEAEYQKLYTIKDLHAMDNDGGTWTFYDSKAAVRSGLQAMLR